MRSIRKYALGVFIVSVLTLALPTYAAPRGGDGPGDTIFAKLKTFIVRVLDGSGLSLPPG
ncbi:MAG TPA: hypothetical protein VLC46_01020 [Thermoanaerobaculia bacterium]|jgi:hypothetical protein|nr:hypothetical protein [Thermoanaerobaculia bacterium]